jgi:hypothetical protein
MKRLLPVALATFALGSCAHQPVTIVPPTPAVSFLTPDGGSVSIDMKDAVEIAPTGIDRPGYRALRIRLTLDNRGPQTWIIDPRLQIAHVGGYSVSFPSDVSASPLVVSPGEVRSLDLFYPIPTPDYGPEVPKHVSLDWKINTPSGLYAHRAEMNRTWYGWSARTVF